MYIKIIRDRGNGDVETVEEVRVNGIQTSSVEPFKSKVGLLLTYSEFAHLLLEIRPAYDPGDADSFSVNIPMQLDWSPEKHPSEIPHHIGFRLAAESTLRAYVGQDDLKFEVG